MRSTRCAGVWGAGGARRLRPVSAVVCRRLLTALCRAARAGSGKTHTLFGNAEEAGLVPMLAEELFARLRAGGPASGGAKGPSWRVDCSVIEIYNERVRAAAATHSQRFTPPAGRASGRPGRVQAAKTPLRHSRPRLSTLRFLLPTQVRDLLAPARAGPAGGLRVREDPARGPYVEGLTLRPAADFAAFTATLEDALKERTIAATAANATSSRAHTLVQLSVTRSTPGAGGVVTETCARIDLVDLAGSERANATGAKGRRLEEGSSINRSLSALGNCIRALSDAQAKGRRAAGAGGAGPAQGLAAAAREAAAAAAAAAASSAAGTHVPFRDSVLTWLLKNSLGGNAKVALVATVSPSEDDHDETLSTLRFADRMQRVETAAVVNEGRRLAPAPAPADADGAPGAAPGGGLASQRSSNNGSSARGSFTPPGGDSHADSPAPTGPPAASRSFRARGRLAAAPGRGKPPAAPQPALSVSPLRRAGSIGNALASEGLPIGGATAPPALAAALAAAAQRRLPAPRGTAAAAAPNGPAAGRPRPRVGAPSPAPGRASAAPSPAPGHGPPTHTQSQPNLANGLGRGKPRLTVTLPAAMGPGPGAGGTHPGAGRNAFPPPSYSLPVVYPPTPNTLFLPPADSPTLHAWAPLPPVFGELPRWDAPIAPVLRASADAGTAAALAAAAAAAAATAAAVEAERAALRRVADSPKGPTPSRRLSNDYLRQLEGEILLKANSGVRASLGAPGFAAAAKPPPPSPRPSPRAAANGNH